ncbi:hypothetical protein B0H13DRAFT_2301655 [Mycena leptocephala]|nr:hypothetical protein B0H13DRAFT_2301655 [Mycena leptocephala]
MTSTDPLVSYLILRIGFTPTTLAPHTWDANAINGNPAVLPALYAYDYSETKVGGDSFHHAPAHRPISMPRTRPRVASDAAPHTNAARLRLPSPPSSPTPAAFSSTTTPRTTFHTATRAPRSNDAHRSYDGTRTVRSPAVLHRAQRVMHTDDAATKLSDRKRSNLSPGKMLCNKARALASASGAVPPQTSSSCFFHPLALAPVIVLLAYRLLHFVVLSLPPSLNGGYISALPFPYSSPVLSLRLRSP